MIEEAQLKAILNEFKSEFRAEFRTELQKEAIEFTKALNQVKDALLGTLESPSGLVSRIQSVHERQTKSDERHAKLEEQFSVLSERMNATDKRFEEYRQQARGIMIAVNAIWVVIGAFMTFWKVVFK